MESEEYVEALVVGSGFGGAVASLRLGQAGVETVVLERGKRWRITPAGDTFCGIATPDGRAAWLSDTTILPAPLPSSPIEVFTGVLDRKVGTGTTAYRGAGVGGGSLIYGGITYQPTKALFETVFPSCVNYDKLDEVYFPRVRAMLQATPIPDDIFQSDAYLSSRILVEQAAKAGLTSIKPDIAIDWNIVREEIAGKKVASIIAGEVYYGTNSGAKNSLDHNYLKQAEETGYVEIKPLHLVNSIEEADGGRYRVQVNEINEQGAVLRQKKFICRYLFLAAGSLGTPELLLRAQSNGTLRHLNNTVGKFWGTNGESTTVLVEGVQTNISLGSPGVIAVQDLNNPVAPLILETFQAEPLPQGVISVLGQGISKPEGFFTYNEKTQMADLFWPINSITSKNNLQALTNTYNLLNQANDTVLAAPIDQVNTGHPVGGAVIGQTCSHLGEVYGHRNLFVLDGSLIPGSAACANPSLTIAALAEQAMDHFLNQSRRW
ncbi:Cholesterol oxidase [Acidisarcina polymorpha]|uniref:Cholesterol oxidase n=2 Tax=Acidisarcina polymorpha TaxID=2211140 RepID=A0A2Z5FUL6_9BACT|nr:Cholesterol oxidase [Acidisarcina polymorpha]